MVNRTINFQNMAVVGNVAAVRGLNGVAGDMVTTFGYYVAGDTGGGSVYIFADTDTTSVDDGFAVLVGTDGGRWHLLEQDVYNLKQAGALMDGNSHPASTRFPTLPAAQLVFPYCHSLTDELDGLVMQYLLNLTVEFRAPAGVILTSYGLDWSSGSNFTGAGRWAIATSLMETLSTTTIRYVGAGGANSYVVKVSAAPMGVLPTDPTTANIQNCVGTNFTIDGNDLAEYGLVEHRSWQGNNFDDITITNTRVCGNWATLGFVKGPKTRYFFKNRGAGWWHGGPDIFSWGVSLSCDEAQCPDWFVYYTGCDQNLVYYNVFTDSAVANPSDTFPTSDNLESECGGMIFGSRSARYPNYQAARCGGPALVIQPTLHGPIVWDGGYGEYNGQSANASEFWETWIQTNADGGSWEIITQEVSFSGPSPTHRITGTQPSRVEQGPVFIRCPLLGKVIVDPGYGHWNKINCESTAPVVGEPPGGPLISEGGFGVSATGLLIQDLARGSFAPALAGAATPGTGWAYAPSNDSIAWYRIGNIVYFTGRVALTAKSADATGNIMLTGFPYPAAPGEGYNAAMAVANEMALTTAVVSMTGYIEQNSTHALLFKRTAAAVAESALVLGDLADTTSFRVSGHYFVADGT